jgi:hypothetical protein
VLGPVTTLQKVAVISSMQKTPVVGAWVGAGVGTGSTSCIADWTADCDWAFDVAPCATAGEAANTVKAEKKSAAISLSLIISAAPFLPDATVRACQDTRKEFEKKPLRCLFRTFRGKLARFG